MKVKYNFFSQLEKIFPPILFWWYTLENGVDVNNGKSVLHLLVEKGDNWLNVTKKVLELGKNIVKKIKK